MAKTEVSNNTLERFAASTNKKVLTSQSDLDPKERPMSEMIAWCKRQGDIVVLSKGDILSANPSSRAVQNCKIVMINKGLRPGKVLAASQNLIQILLANAPDLELRPHQSSNESVSVQQQRLRQLIKEAVFLDASDIHIEVRQDIAKIRFRKHGEMYLHAEWLPSVAREVASVAFNKETDHAGTHFNPLIPQNASMPVSLDGREVRLRLASMPAHGGFDMVMRILATSTQIVPDLEELGYSTKQVNLIRKAISVPHGAVIVAGPTGSGKTTTLASCMKLIDTERKIYTIEDPIEKIIDHATQVPVSTEHSDRGFASMGRACLRMDPDVIVLGEMRDEDTANVMVRASITGHLVFSTLHTNTAPAIVTRLHDMGISLGLLSDPNLLVCLICQRLVPKLCQKCSVPIDQSTPHLAKLEKWHKVFGDGIKNLRARGSYCNHCHGLGISGRTVVAEVIWVDEQSRLYIQKGDILGWEKYLKSHGWTTYKDQAHYLVSEGICDVLDAEKVVGPFDPVGMAEEFDYTAADTV